jgi:hypothetical protein
MPEPYLPTVEEIAELRRTTAYATEAGEPPADIASDWVRDAVGEPDGGFDDVLTALAAMRARVAELETERAAVKALATKWATQGTDYDEDTEQQIDDGRAILAALGEVRTDA